MQILEGAAEQTATARTAYLFSTVYTVRQAINGTHLEQHQAHLSAVMQSFLV
jgi:hypothetical protein